MMMWLSPLVSPISVPLSASLVVGSSPPLPLLWRFYVLDHFLPPLTLTPIEPCKIPLSVDYRLFLEVRIFCIKQKYSLWRYHSIDIHSISPTSYFIYPILYMYTSINMYNLIQSFVSISMGGRPKESPNGESSL